MYNLHAYTHKHTYTHTHFLRPGMLLSSIPPASHLASHPHPSLPSQGEDRHLRGCQLLPLKGQKTKYGKGVTGVTRIAKCRLLLVSHQHLQICVISKPPERFATI